MTILLINNLYPPYIRGGAERVVETIAQGLKSVGHRVVVVTTVPSWSMNLQAFIRGGWVQGIVNGITVYRIATANFFPYWTIGRHNAIARFFWHVFDFFAVETAFTVKRILRIEKPDVVMTHNLMGLGFLLPRAIRSMGVKHIHTVHDVQLSVPSGQIFVWRRLSFLFLRALLTYERLIRWLFSSPHVVIAPSQWLLDFYTNRGFFMQSQTIKLENPVTIERPIGQKIVTAWRDPSVLRLLFVGQLEEHKGVLFLIDTIKQFQISDFRFQIHLDIVGDGVLLSRIKNIADGDRRIRVHGRIENSAMSSFYANADVVVIPSLVHENSPTVILEAFAHGVPVIASRVGGIPELVRDGETGWTFAAGDRDALFAVVQTVFDRQGELSRMGENARKRVRENTVENYITALLRVVEEKR